LELDCQNFPVPTGVQRELVVSEHVGPSLRRGEVRQTDDRHLFHVDQFRGCGASMAGDDLEVFTDQDRIREAELLNAFGDLS
jgi:hypothetical protein